MIVFFFFPFFFSTIAFTWAPEQKYEELLAAVKDATYTGIKEAGIDVRCACVCVIGSL